MSIINNSNVLIIGVEDVVKAQHGNSRGHPTVPKAFHSAIKQVLMTQFLETTQPNVGSNLLNNKREDSRNRTNRLGKQTFKNHEFAKTHYEKDRSASPSVLVRKRPVKHHRYELLAQQNCTALISPNGNASSHVFRSVMNSLESGPNTKKTCDKMGRVWRDRKRDNKRFYSRCVFQIPLPKEFSPENRHYTQYKTTDDNSIGNQSELLIKRLARNQSPLLQNIQIKLDLKLPEKKRSTMNDFRPRYTNTSIKYLRRPSNGSNYAVNRLENKMSSFSHNIQLGVSEMKLNHKEKVQKADRNFLQRLRQVQRTAFNRSRSNSIGAAAAAQQQQRNHTTTIQRKTDTFLSPWLDIFQDFNGF